MEAETISAYRPSGLIDLSALRVNQTGIAATVLVAFVGGVVIPALLLLIPLLAAILLLGTFNPRSALFKQAYFQFLKPGNIVKLRRVADRMESHNFAQGLGGVFLVVASVFLPLLPVVALLVAILAFVNLAFGYCVGCQIYYQLSRAGVLKA